MGKRKAGGKTGRHQKKSIRKSIDGLFRKMTSFEHRRDINPDVSESAGGSANAQTSSLPFQLFSRLESRDDDGLGWQTLKGALEALWVSSDGESQQIHDKLLRGKESSRVLDAVLRVFRRVWSSEQERLNGEQALPCLEANISLTGPLLSGL